MFHIVKYTTNLSLFNNRNDSFIYLLAIIIYQTNITYSKVSGNIII